jgi:hypothetical protein
MTFTDNVSSRVYLMIVKTVMKHRRLQMKLQKKSFKIVRDDNDNSNDSYIKHIENKKK